MHHVLKICISKVDTYIASTIVEIDYSLPNCDDYQWMLMGVIFFHEEEFDTLSYQKPFCQTVTQLISTAKKKKVISKNIQSILLCHHHLVGQHKKIGGIIFEVTLIGWSHIVSPTIICVRFHYLQEFCC